MELNRLAKGVNEMFQKLIYNLCVENVCQCRRIGASATKPWGKMSTKRATGKDTHVESCACCHRHFWLVFSPVFYFMLPMCSFFVCLSFAWFLHRIIPKFTEFRCALNRGRDDLHSRRSSILRGPENFIGKKWKCEIWMCARSQGKRTLWRHKGDCSIFVSWVCFHFFRWHMVSFKAFDLGTNSMNISDSSWLQTISNEHNLR